MALLKVIESNDTYQKYISLEVPDVLQEKRLGEESYFKELRTEITDVKKLIDKVISLTEEVSEIPEIMVYIETLQKSLMTSAQLHQNQFYRNLLRIFQKSLKLISNCEHFCILPYFQTISLIVRLRVGHFSIVFHPLGSRFTFFVAHK